MKSRNLPLSFERGLCLGVVDQKELRISIGTGWNGSPTNSYRVALDPTWIFLVVQLRRPTGATGLFEITQRGTLSQPSVAMINIPKTVRYFQCRLLRIQKSHLNMKLPLLITWLWPGLSGGRLPSSYIEKKIKQKVQFLSNSSLRAARR